MRPAVKVLVVGEPSLVEPIHGEVVAACAQGNALHVVRCRTAAALPSTLAAIGAPIDVLEIFDHGRPGAIRLGDSELFASDADPSTPLAGWETAAAIAPHLAETAHVKLLGCDTAALGPQALVAGDPGRSLLVKLALELGGRRQVFGTIEPIGPGNFDAQGFAGDTYFLFSSSAALDAGPPTPNARGEHIAAMLSGYCRRTPDSPACMRLATERAVMAERSESRS